MPETNIHEKKMDEDVIHMVSVPMNVTQIACEVFQNLPEASMNLQCTSWKYDDFEFKFVDYEDEEAGEHVVTLKEAEKGVAMVIDKIMAKKLFVGGIDSIDKLCELGNWDAEVVDACVQCAIFGDVIYG